MEFFNSAVEVLQTLVIALGAGLGIWGGVNLMEELSTAPNIVSKQIVSVIRIKRKPQNDSAKQGKKDTIIL